MRKIFMLSCLLFVSFSFLLFNLFIFTTSIEPSIEQSNISHISSSVINTNTYYPLNKFGQTFGGDIKEITDQGPDLILAQNEEGLVGYVKATDMDPDPPTTPDQAASYQSKSFFVPMYTSDGCTKIGEFKIGQ